MLPMVNLSGDSAQDYFAEGMTETLIAGVAKVTALRVTSRTSVMQFKGSQKPIKEIANDLGVDGLIEGSVQRFGDNIRVHVRLIHAATDQVIWDQNMSETCTTCCLFKTRWHEQLRKQFRSSSAQSKSCALKLRDASILRPTTSFCAAGFTSNRKTKLDNAIAIEALGRAVSIDGEFAAAWAELAQAYVWKLFLFAPNDKSLELEAFRAVDKALKLDVDLPEAYLARGRLL